MNKALMISIQPQYAVNILNGKKTRELRTWIPKGYVGWVNVYVSEGVGKTKYHHLYNLTEYNNGKTLFSITHHNKHSLVPDGFLNGKVVFRFWFDEYDDIVYNNSNEYVGCNGNTLSDWSIGSFYLDKLQLTYNSILDYGKGKDLYAWHIKKLEVFDEPKQLSEFKTVDISKYQDEYGNPAFDDYFELTKAPQKMAWVYIK